MRTHATTILTAALAFFATTSVATAELTERELMTRVQKRVQKREQRREQRREQGVQVLDVEHREDMTRIEFREPLGERMTFEECIAQSLTDCQSRIAQFRTDNPDEFDTSISDEELIYQVRQVRAAGNPNYYRIGIMMNETGTGVSGLGGDGIIRFNNPNFGGQNVWCASDTPCYGDPNRNFAVIDKCCYSIGPWDCDTGEADSFEGCCERITSTVAGYSPDHMGHDITCHAAWPLGHELNPIVENRIQVRVNENGIVLGSPVNA